MDRRAGGRPMTLTIRPARAFELYEPIRSLPEPDLIPTIRVEFCACGEYVRQLAGDSITDTVRRHNRDVAHLAWRYLTREPLLDPTVAPGAGDVSHVPAMRPVGERRR